MRPRQKVRSFEDTHSRLRVGCRSSKAEGNSTACEGRACCVQSLSARPVSVRLRQTHAFQRCSFRPPINGSSVFRRLTLVALCWFAFVRDRRPLFEKNARFSAVRTTLKKNDGPVSQVLSFTPRRLCVSVRCAGSRVKTARRCSCEVRVLDQAAGVDGELSECGRSTHCLQTRVVFLSNFFSGIRACSFVGVFLLSWLR
jgi:hypothetical protein